MFQLWGGPIFFISFYIFCFYYRGPLFRHFSLFIFSLNCDSAFLIQTHATYSEPAPTYLAAPQVDVQQKKKKKEKRIASGCRHSLLHKGSLICNKQRGVQFAVDSHGGKWRNRYMAISKSDSECHFSSPSPGPACCRCSSITDICVSIYDYYSLCYLSPSSFSFRFSHPFSFFCPQMISNFQRPTFVRLLFRSSCGNPTPVDEIQADTIIWRPTTSVLGGTNGH